MKAFKAPSESIGPTDAETTAALITTATDFAMVVDGQGIIQDLAFQRTDLSMELDGGGKWFGRNWGETVTPASQAKVEALIKEAGTHSASRWRQLNHASSRGRDVPLLYAAVRLGESDRFIALARDLRAVSALQQRLVDAQMAMERDYAQLRFAETRYRLLFQTAAEAVIVLDANSHKVVELNPAAIALLAGANSRKVVGRSFSELLAAPARSAAQVALAGLRTGDTGAELTATLADGRVMTMMASLFHQDATALVLVRLQPAANQAVAGGSVAGSVDRADLADFARAAPDGFVVCDHNCTVVACNDAFARMVQIGNLDGVRGNTLDQWLGRPGVDLDVITANLRQHGSVRLFSTELRGESGATLSVEVSAVLLPGTGHPSFGFAVRDIGRRLSLPDAARPAADLPHTATELAGLIGRVPLKDLVRETSDVIEKLCIEKALELTDDNRASAAEMLGLSRQSLYVKMRRFGIVGADDEASV